MWAGDGTQDGQVTALDFTLWLAASTAGATGYEPSDYNRDQVVTGPDEDLWWANTTAGARAPHVLSDAIHAIPPLQSGPMPLGAGSPTSQIRLNVTRDDGNDFWVSVEARADTSLLPDNTVGSATIDVHYDASKFVFQSFGNGVLTSQDGYRETTVDLAEGPQHFVRLSIACSGIGSQPSTQGHDLGTDWEVLGTLRYSRIAQGPGTEISVAARSLSLGFFDSPANENGSSNIVESLVDIQ